MKNLKGGIVTALVVVFSLGQALAQENTNNNLAALYAAAVEDAAALTADELAPLRPLVCGTRGIVCDNRGRVLVVTWTNWAGYTPQTSQTLAREIWVTPYGEIRNRCQAAGLTGADLDLRLRQCLGLPPNDPATDRDDKSWFVEMWVPTKAAFRPCLDMETDDEGCRLSATEPRPKATRPGTPTSVTWVTEEMTVHRAWYADLLKRSYTGSTPYPWTRAGYTCDWVEGKCAVGPQEYVVRAPTEVRIHSVTPTEEYINPGLHIGSK